MALNWIEEVEGLGSAPLTVQAQAVSVSDNDEFIHPNFFPAVQADSVELAQIFETDPRFASDRREWNARGRYIPTPLPSIDRLEMVPLEAYDKIGEREQQKLRERAMANEAIFRELISASVPGRVNKLVMANFRRLEIEAMEAASKGQITAHNPVTGESQVLNLDFGDHIQTASPAWTDETAYDLFVQWLEDGEAEIGAINAVVMSRFILKQIQKAAPNPVPGVDQDVQISRTNLQSLIEDELGHGFRIFTLDNQFDVFADGGTATTRQRVFPQGYITAIPASGTIGALHRAPVSRAVELAAAFPGESIDVRGQTVYYDYENGGRTAVLECQANWLALPEQRNVWSINTGMSPA